MSGSLTACEFAEITGVSRETLERLTCYSDLLARWQRTFNLVSGGSLADLWRRHMLDSFQLAAHVPASVKGREVSITDLGSGAGFPGLVLSIVTGHAAQLVEADARKCAFLREAVRVTGSSATVVNARVTPASIALEKRSADILVARALAPLEELCALAWPFRPRACLFPKGENWARELTEAKKTWNMSVESFQSITRSSSRILRLSGISPITAPTRS